MREIPADKTELFDEAVCALSGEGSIQIAADRLDTFLQQIHSIELPASEKLRQLAIALEHEEFTDGWHGLRAIYEAAVASNPQDATIYHSWSVSAIEWMDESRTPSLTARISIATEAEHQLNAALKLEPVTSDFAHQLGMVCYNHPLHKEDRHAYLLKALNWFEQALLWDSDCVMSQLYRAHCYHDLANLVDAKHWRQAADSYAKVDQQRLTADWPAWRAVKCREQLAACLAWSGNEVEARRHFTAFLDEIEAYPLDESGMNDWVVNLDELADTVVRKLRDLELLQRTRNAAQRYGFEIRYPALFADNVSA